MDATTRRARADPAPATLDELATRLVEFRARAGSPSFSEIARRVTALRTARGVRASERSPGRITVYDCFRAGRRRVDAALLLDIVRALGADAAETARWREWCVALQRPEAGDAVVPTHRDAPALAHPFVGRAVEADAVMSATGPVLVTGPPGAGKTQVAARALRALRSVGRIDGIVTVDLRASNMSTAGVGAATLLESVARTLGIERAIDAIGPAALGERAQCVADALERAGVALLVDDAGALGAVLPLLEHVTSTPLVVISRTLLPVPPSVRVVEVTTWTGDDGMALLTDAAGAERVAAEPGAAADIVALSGGLPLAMALAAARVGGKPDWTLAEHRDALRARLDAGRLDDPVSDSIALSLRLLADEERRALRLFATLPCEDLPADLVAIAVGPAGAERLQASLLSSHCVEERMSGRLGMHALIRAYAAALSWDDDPQSARDQALDRLADACVDRAWSAATALRPGHPVNFPNAPQSPAPMALEAAEAWLAAETNNLVLIAEALAERRPEVLVGIAQALGWYLDRQGLQPLALRLHARASALGQRIGDTTAVAIAENAIGQAKLRLGHDDAVAQLERAAALAETTGLPRLRITVMNALAIAAAQSGDIATALTRFEQTLALSREHGFDEFVGLTIDNIAVSLRRLGDIQGALERHREAYELACAHGDMLRAATAISNLSDDQLAVGDVEGALASATRAVELTASGGGETHAYAVTNLGLARAARGDVDEAIACHEQALSMARAMSDPVLEAAVLSNLGVALRASGRAAEAVAALELALEVATAHDIAYERGRAVLELAETVHGCGDAARARALAVEAVAAFPDERSPERSRALGLLERTAA
ncbi:MAG: tetratricopeptide repeat protein [Microbacterium sp.]|uniref:tetratricopeptide repeat protein n=1 Tax=Microbacterium sp. TaxID=51671 RepID=UPI0039E385C7